MEKITIEVIEGPNGTRIFLGKNFPGIYFTVREAQLAQLLGDYKYYEIGELLTISKRTAEYYSMNMKKKLRCENKRELVYVLRTSGLLAELKAEVDISHLFKEADSKNSDNNNVTNQTDAANDDNKLEALVCELIGEGEEDE
jgi:DNA-binding CsgD family transcriptional regulator